MTSTASPTTDLDPSGSIPAGTEENAAVEDLLIEEVSIDGLCGVY